LKIMVYTIFVIESIKYVSKLAEECKIIKARCVSVTIFIVWYENSLHFKRSNFLRRIQ